MTDVTAKTILLVEDEALIAMSSKASLERYGYSVKVVSSANKAIEAMNKREPIDIILMDINLGDGLDGTQAAEVILKDHDIPIVFVSSHSEREIVEKTEKITSFGYVVKNSSITVYDASIKMAFKLSNALKSEKAKERALSESEKRYRLISESLSDGIIHLDANGTIDYASAVYNAQIGLKGDKTVGRDSVEISTHIHPDDKDSLLRFIYSAIEEKRGDLTYQYRMRHQDGRYIWREDHASFVYDEKGVYEGAYVICRDITERVELEKRLSILNRAVEASPICVVITDKKGEIEYVNPYFEAMTGYSSADVIGKNPRILKSGLTRPEVYSELWDCLIKGKVWKGVFANKRKDGSLFYEHATIAPVVASSSGIESYIALKEDITAQVLGKEMYDMVFNYTRDGIVRTDMAGNFLDFNEHFAGMVGYSADELHHMNYHEITPAIWDDMEKHIIDSQLLSRGFTDVYQKEYRRKNGSIFPVEINAYLVKDSGVNVGMWGTARDVTQQAGERDFRERLSTFSDALKKVTNAIISSDDPDVIISEANRIVGETLAVDRILIYDVSFKNDRISPLCEWLSMSHADIEPTKGDYTSLDMFRKPFSHIRDSKKHLVSYADDINEHFSLDGSGEILHVQLKIQSLLWFPFLFDSHGYYCFTINQILSKREWRQEEITFLELVANDVALALDKIRLIRGA